MRLYTRTGDQGQTSLIGGRVSKDDLRVDAYGTVDELNSFLGLAISELKEINEGDLFADIEGDLLTIQHELFDCAADLANVSKRRPFKLKEESIQNCEEWIDKLIEEAPKLEKFILPGGTKAAASLQIVRTINRRAERAIVALENRDGNVSEVVLNYINRLSDYFFIVARIVNFRSGVADVEYERSGLVFRKGRRKETSSD